MEPIRCVWICTIGFEKLRCNSNTGFLTWAWPTMISKKENATMACDVIIRRHDGVQSYLVLSESPCELLRHPGFQDEFSVRAWLGSIDPTDAMEEWAAMMGEDPTIDFYLITTDDNWEYCADKSNWACCLKK